MSRCPPDACRATRSSALADDITVICMCGNSQIRSLKLMHRKEINQVIVHFRIANPLIAKGSNMKTSLKTSLVLAALLGAVAGPVLAGNYAEGDPRPAPLASSTSRAAVASDTQRWLQSAADQGYPEGNPRAVVSVSANSRAVVQADTLAWMRSGLAAAMSGEAGADTARPPYRQAAAAYARLRGEQPEFGTPVERLTQQGQMPDAPATVRR